MTSDSQYGGSPPSPPVHREWAHLRLIEEIGRGGFGRVYRAWDTTLAREVALKLVAIPELDAEAVAEVLHEGRMLARVRHPNVVTVYGALQVGQEFGLWMELVRGRSLADVVRKDGPLGAEEAAVVALSVCRALAAVHGAGLVHRDVKAQNVMREAGGRILLMDFGAGLDPALPSTQSLGRAPGTPNYMAPEVIAGQPATPASDLYSVGVLLYFLVTGRHPFEGRTLAEIAVGQGLRRRRLLTDDRPDLPEGFIRIVDRALAIDPEHRFSSAGALIQELTDSAPAGRPSWAAPYSVTETAATTDAPRAPDPTPSRGSGVTPQSGGATSPAAARTPWVRLLSWSAVGAAAVPWVVGLLTSMAFNTTLGRSTTFAGESPFAWWVWGLRTLLAPAVYIAAGIVAYLLVRSIWRLARQISGPFDRWCARLGERFTEWLRQSPLDDLAVRGQLLVLVEALVLAGIIWQFGSIILAQFTLIGGLTADRTAPLQPANVGEHAVYGVAIDASILVMGAGWLAIVRARRRRGLAGFDGSVLAGLAALGLAFLFLWVLPYRITWHNEFQRVAYEGERCYAIGQRQEDLLLHCPDLPPPRNRVVQENGNVRRLDVFESIFTPPSPGVQPDSDD